MIGIFHNLPRVLLHQMEKCSLLTAEQQNRLLIHAFLKLQMLKLQIEGHFQVLKEIVLSFIWMDIYMLWGVMDKDRNVQRKVTDIILKIKNGHL